MRAVLAACDWTAVAVLAVMLLVASAPETDGSSWRQPRSLPDTVYLVG
jgi:hypothetical protein